MALTCSFCGRQEADCPGGLYSRGSSWLTVSICQYCCRVALRALGGLEEARVIPIGRCRPRIEPPEPPEAA